MLRREGGVMGKNIQHHGAEITVGLYRNLALWLYLSNGILDGKNASLNKQADVC